MAKGKGKKVAGAGPRRTHGPKKKMFHCWSSTMRLSLANAGLLNKYNNFEAWQQACQAKGNRTATKSKFNEFIRLTREEQDSYFAKL